MDRIKKISLILFFISGSCYAQRVEAVKAVGKYYLSGGVQTPKILNYINLGGIAFSIGFELKDRRLVRKLQKTKEPNHGATLKAFRRVVKPRRIKRAEKKRKKTPQKKEKKLSKNLLPDPMAALNDGQSLVIFHLNKDKLDKDRNKKLGRKKA